MSVRVFGEQFVIASRRRDHGIVMPFNGLKGVGCFRSISKYQTQCFVAESFRKHQRYLISSKRNAQTKRELVVRPIHPAKPYGISLLEESHYSLRRPHRNGTAVSVIH